MTTRRVVRVAPSFFEVLDRLLPSERTPTGSPSTADFLVHDLPRVIDLLAVDFEGATLPVPDEADVRALITVGTLVGYMVVYAALVDDVVVILSIGMDTS